MRRSGSALLFGVLAICLGATAAAQSPREIVRGPLGKQLDGHVSRLEGLGFAGVVLVEKDGVVILKKGYGLANRATSQRFTAQTPFDIGSVTKQFTAAAVLKLEMQGKLRVSDPISRFFDGVPADKQAITLHYLLTHTSGLENGFGDDYDAMSRDALVAKALASKLQSAPGSRFSYSNAGYSLLGAIIEKVSGQPYEQFLQDQLFRPAGMTKTGYRLPRWKSAELAHGYQGDSDWGTPLDHPWAPDGPWWNLRANGGMLSTAEDLNRWREALEGDRILSAEAKAKMVTPYVKESDSGPFQYGYGWFVSTTDRGTRLAAHTGSNGVFYTDFQRYLDDRVAVIAGSSQTEIISPFVSAAVGAAMFGQAIAPPPQVAKLEPAALQRFAGEYVLPSGGRLAVTAPPPSSDGLQRIVLTPQGLDAYELLTGNTGPKPGVGSAVDEARLLSALEATRVGNYELLATVYGTSADEAKGEMNGLMADLERRFGAFRRFKTLGGATRGPRATTWISFEFVKGERMFEHVWTGANVTSFRPVDGVRMFFPESENGLFSYDLRNGKARHIASELESDVAKSLILEGASGKVRATRVDAGA
jgi:CubicO group peptidase (beta-lactamase class C family)